MHFLVMAALPVNLCAVGTNVECFHLSEHRWRDFFHPDAGSTDRQRGICAESVKTVRDCTHRQWNIVRRQMTTTEML